MWSSGIRHKWMVEGKTGYKITKDWYLVKDPVNYDVVLPVEGDLFSDVDICLHELFRGGELKQTDGSVGAESYRVPDPLVWKWAWYFDWRNYAGHRHDYRAINVDGPVNIADGYGNMTVNLVREILNLNVDVVICRNWHKQNRLDDAPGYIKFSNTYNRFLPTVRLSQLDSATNTVGSFIANWSMWEFERFTNSMWVNGGNSINLCIVPCGWNKLLWKQEGILKDTVVVPLGVDTSKFNFRERLPKPVFTFLTDGSILGGNRLLDIWAEKYINRKDVELIVKYPYPVEFESFKNIRVIDERFSVDQMVDLYWSADCFIYPTQAEGFGLMPLEAMATGLPTIVTRLPATAQYVWYDLCMPIPVKRIDWYHIPDEDIMVSWIDAVMERKWDLDIDTHHVSNFVRTHFSWKESAKKLLGVMGYDKDFVGW